jgi:hypothetical protein
MAKYESWLSSNRTTDLSLEGLARAARCFTYLTKCSFRHLPRRMDGVINDSVGEVVLPHPPLPFCSILPKYGKKSENPSPHSLLTSHVFAELSQLVAVLKACYSYMTSSCKYTLFSFLNRTEKTGVAVSGTRPCVLREYVYVNG